MKKMLQLALILMFSVLSVAHAEISQEKRNEIEKMLRLTGTEKLMNQMMAQMIMGMKSKMTGIPDTFWGKFQQKIDSHGLMEQLIPVYDKYYTVEDLKAVNAFYESPAGQKVLSTLPQITRESMKIGQEWGEKIARQIAEEAQRDSNGK